MAIETIGRTDYITGIDRIEVTEIVVDEINGGFLRDVRVFLNDSDLPAFTLRLHGADEQKIVVKTPELTF